MAVATGQLTYEDLCRAREDGNRYELIEGEPILVAAPSPLHQWVNYLLGAAFHDAVVEPGRGFVFPAPVDVHLGGRSYVQPDLLVVLRERASIIGETLIEGAPDLVVETLSRSSRAVDRNRKLRLSARSGVREYWLVDLAARVVVVHADPAGETYRTVQRETVVARSTIIPGLAVDLADLFRGFSTQP